MDAHPFPNRRQCQPGQAPHPRALALAATLALMIPSPWTWASPGPGPRPSAYALVVASHRGGQGQQDLRFAGRDADLVRDVLRELGGYLPTHITTLTDPDDQAILRALDALEARLKAHHLRGEPSQLLFYYSGHARARAITLGSNELPLSVLRERLTRLPATLTLVVLDACQTGAFSRVKGATPATDFSYNSVADFNTTGVAVLASSTASELSQEADTLGASYFTHHLVVGLRGAADANADGSVTLDEAYRYAYHRTLVSTAMTAVGRQHVTLETHLRGKGEMVLTTPAQFRSQLELPSSLSGPVLLHRESDRLVLAELDKARGRGLRLALAPGRYTAVVRPSPKTLLRCPLSLVENRVTTLSLTGCTPVQTRPTLAKGPGPERRERLALELGVGGLFRQSDAYTQRLETFGFETELFQLDRSLSAHAALSYAFDATLSLLLGYTLLDGGSYTREAIGLGHEKLEQTFTWRTHGVGLYLRGTLPLFHGVFNPYLQGGGGLGIGESRYTDPLQASTEVDDQLHLGYHLSILAGVHVMPWTHLGFFLQGGYHYAPVIENLLGDTHNGGGPLFHLGLRAAL